ncbi:MAG: hypothetical protein ABIG96_00225 [Candidatus Micrarchaeota archaeon]
MRNYLWGLLFCCLVISPLVSANVVIRLFNYTVFDENGIAVQNGYSLPCWSTPTPSEMPIVLNNISGGHQFTLNINLGNIGSDPEDGMRLSWGNQDDEYGLSRCSSYDPTRCPIRNFSNYNLSNGNLINISSGTNITLTQHLIAKPNEEGFFYVTPNILTAGSGGSDCRGRVGIRLTDPNGYYKMGFRTWNPNPWTVLLINITNFNDPNFYHPSNAYAPPFVPPGSQGDGLQNVWDIYFNTTIINLGTIQAPVDYSFLCEEMDANLGIGDSGIKRLRCAGNASAWNQGTTGPIAPGGELEFSCPLYNATNTSWDIGRGCGSGVHCMVGLVNNAYNYGAYDDWGYIGQLGRVPCPPPVVTWHPSMYRPWLSSLFAVPGLDFNITTQIISIGALGNYTVNDNINLTTNVVDAAFASLYTYSKFLLPQGGKTMLNVTSSSGDAYFQIFPNMTMKVPHDSEPKYYWSLLNPTQYLESTAASRNQFTVTRSCDFSRSPPNTDLTPWNWYSLPFFANVSICGWNSYITLTRLILINNFNNITVFVFPGQTFDINYTVRNPMEYPLDFVLNASPYGPTPITLVFMPDRSTVGRATLIPGNNSGILRATIPLGTPLTTYTFKVLANSSNPQIWDTGIINFVVVAHDTEIISINKKPDAFIYNPSEVERIGLTVTIRNNLPLPENATLNLTIRSSLQDTFIINCKNDPSANEIGMGPMETMEIDCGAHVNLSDYFNENIVVIADLGIVDGIDSFPQNNHRMEIITVVSDEQPPIAVPELETVALLLTALSALWIMRVKRK